MNRIKIKRLLEIISFWDKKKEKKHSKKNRTKEWKYFQTNWNIFWFYWLSTRWLSDLFFATFSDILCYTVLIYFALYFSREEENLSRPSSHLMHKKQYFRPFPTKTKILLSLIVVIEYIKTKLPFIPNIYIQFLYSWHKKNNCRRQSKFLFLFSVFFFLLKLNFVHWAIKCSKWLLEQFEEVENSLRITRIRVNLTFLCFIFSFRFIIS